jgi:hypothetical protein
MQIGCEGLETDDFARLAIIALTLGHNPLCPSLPDLQNTSRRSSKQ